MQHPNFIALIVASLVPMIIGFIWYNPKVVGNAWMKEAGVTTESAKGMNMPLVFGLAFFFALMLSFSLQSVVIHQLSVGSALYYALNDPTRAEAAKSTLALFTDNGIYANEGRTIHHGVFHGVLATLFLIFPALATNAMFERKSFKYIAINVGYWAICLGIMGGIISVWK